MSRILNDSLLPQARPSCCPLQMWMFIIRWQWAAALFCTPIITAILDIILHIRATEEKARWQGQDELKKKKKSKYMTPAGKKKLPEATEELYRAYIFFCPWLYPDSHNVCKISFYPWETHLSQSKDQICYFRFSFSSSLSHPSGYSRCSWRLWFGDLPYVHRPPTGGELIYLIIYSL